MNTAILASSVAALLASLAPAAFFQTRDTMPPVLDDFCNSAAVPFGTMTVNVDITENDSPTLPGEASVFYSTNGQSSWTQTSLAAVPGYPAETWGASFSAQGAAVHYYFMVHDDSAATFGSPVNSADVFPPGANLLANPADEPAGDAVNAGGSYLDLNGAGFGYSNDHFYVTLSNVSGTWPRSGGILGPWYIYSGLIMNPDAGTPGFAFALLYANVPLLLSNGLYALNLVDSSYTRIADIDCTVQGGDLHMRCNLADLYAQPGFGPDNPSGCYGVAGGTATADVSGSGSANDGTYGYFFYHRTGVVSVSSNTPPILTGPGYEVVPPGASRETALRFRVAYCDGDGNLPVVRDLVLDGVHMQMGTGAGHDYAAGVRFELDTPVTDEEHVYYFSFSDGVASIETPPDTIPAPTGVAAGGESFYDARSLEVLGPNPFTGTTRIQYAVPVSPGAVVVAVYDVAGRLVRELDRGTLAPGSYTLTWDGRDAAGRGVASGVYFVRLDAGAATQVCRLVFVQ